MKAELRQDGLDEKEKEGTRREVWSILCHRIKLGCLIVSDAAPFETFPIIITSSILALAPRTIQIPFKP
jgi:hypothetical protein